MRKVAVILLAACAIVLPTVLALAGHFWIGLGVIAAESVFVAALVAVKLEATEIVVRLKR